ncbi:MAG TPA: neutral zinc metallopeptidase, partial [Vicinamibacteria bacterium]|nr:neutral zinc metallopeptidase [Vicinamibacteria bacterium]
MRWTSRGRSADLEDRRGQRMSRGGTIGCGTLLLLIALSVVFKQDFVSLLGPAFVSNEPMSTSTGDFQTSPEEEQLVDFMSFVLDDLQSTWARILAERFQRARMVLFRDVVQSACGMAGAATGPFYCPGDGKIYLDLSFFQELRSRFGAPGDFAQAYVIAHEMGHHIQNLLGIESEVRRLQSMSPGNTNELSVRLELQADCLAGVWGHSTSERGLLDRDDPSEALEAAAAIGDDRIQRQTQGWVSPESFTHGSSAERQEWF